ncbi:hypothetical protein KKH18_09220 [bacterium]|nr:hypothetical protein [bacterium]
MTDRIQTTGRHLIAAVMLLFAAGAAPAQYEFNYGVESDTTKADTTKADTTGAVIEAEALPVETPVDELVGKAITWTRRMLYRGFPSLSTTGTWATYQESDWGLKQGAHGSIRAHFTVNYLGAIPWMSKQAEHMQIVYRTLDAPKMTIEFDLVFSMNDGKIETIHRSLYRVNKGELTPASFDLPENTLDYDRLDKPKSDERAELRLYSGTYDATVYSGTGINAAKVYAYRVAGLPPLDLVMLGYGNEALIYKSGGDGAEERFEAPLPSVR